MQAACQDRLTGLLYNHTFFRLYEMTNTDLTIYRERLLALRARLLGDMTQMEDNALNKDHSKTTSMPTNMAELGSDNSDQELTLSLLGSEKAPSTRLKQPSSGSTTAAMAGARSAVKNPQAPPGRHPLCRRCASNVLRKQEEGQARG